MLYGLNFVKGATGFPYFRSEIDPSAFLRDKTALEEEKTTPQQNATQAQLPEKSETEILSEVADLIGGGGWTRTNDLRIMRPSL